MSVSRILVVHNSYQHAGGEDAVFVAETALLRQRGRDVVEYTEDNKRINGMSQVSVAAQSMWSTRTCLRLLQILRSSQPHVAHFHNIFPLISPSAYSACRKVGVPVVQTLHNFRLLCPAATFFRDGRVCEDCMHRTPPWPGIVHACYRDSRGQTGVVAVMLAVHWWLKTWSGRVDVYIALTEFARKKFIQGGIPAEKIVVKPNFVHPDPGMRESGGEYALFVGRLSPEKGVSTLLKAWRSLKDVPLNIAGEGPLCEKVHAFINREKLENVELLGQRSHEEIVALMKGARFLVFPSEWYEGFPMTLVEAFACGVPVVASRLGGMAEIVEEGHTGLFFQPGDSANLAEKVRWAMDHPDAMREMGVKARQAYEEKYTAEKNYQILLNIYERAVGEAEQTRKSHDATWL